MLRPQIHHYQYGKLEDETIRWMRNAARSAGYHARHSLDEIPEQLDIIFGTSRLLVACRTTEHVNSIIRVNMPRVQVATRAHDGTLLGKHLGSLLNAYTYWNEIQTAKGNDKVPSHEWITREHWYFGQ